MNSLKPIRLHKLKVQAIFLLKELESNSEKSGQAASRFLQIPIFKKKSSQWIIANVESVQLKHAYHVLAYEAGFKTWTELKHTVINYDCLYKSNHIRFIHAWFKDYQQSEVYFKKNGGYLISFWKDFVVCGKEYITSLDLIQYEEHWKSIGYNWVKPDDKKAFQFLKEMAIKNYLSKK